MDSRNLFETPTTYRLHRAEWMGGLVVATVLMVQHWHQIRILPFVLLFVYIDLIGYVPGAIAAHRSQDGYIHKGYYVLYNSMHCLLSAGTVAGLYCLFVKPEWALLALPFHLGLDRAIVGNTLKPFGVPFEPQEHPVYYAVRPLLDRPRKPEWAEKGHPVSEPADSVQKAVAAGAGQAG